MSTVGLVGGLGPESTIDYYRLILDLWKARQPSSLPHLVIDSLDVNVGIRLVQNDRPGLVRYLLDSIRRLERAGCEFAAMAANTPHIVFDELAAESPIPLLSIVECCADAVEARGFRRVGLLGTGFTMAAGFYPAVLDRRGIGVVVPDEHRRSWLHDRYLTELLNGVFTDETRAGVTQIVEDWAEQGIVDAVILAGTELPLLIRSETLAGLPLLDTTGIHVRAIVERLSDRVQQPAT
ncbi:MAG TPA: amino acid racemase [Longimicrobiales bacterium]